jgi:hypothetical protein
MIASFQGLVYGLHVVFDYTPTLLLTSSATLAATHLELTDPDALAGRSLFLAAAQELIQEDVRVSPFAGATVKAQDATYRRG